MMDHSLSIKGILALLIALGCIANHHTSVAENDSDEGNDSDEENDSDKENDSGESSSKESSDDVRNTDDKVPDRPKNASREKDGLCCENQSDVAYYKIKGNLYPVKNVTRNDCEHKDKLTLCIPYNILKIKPQDPQQLLLFACNMKGCSESVTVELPKDDSKVGPTNDNWQLLYSLAVVIVIVIPLAAIYFRRRRGNNNTSGREQVPMVPLPDNPPEPSAISGNIYTPFPLRVNKEGLEEHLLKAIDSIDTENEFESVDYIMKKSCSVAEMPENQAKNRYKDIIPYNSTRVVLPTLPNELHSDYINASFIKSHNQNDAFIAAQGPLDGAVNTVSDFWRMVMLTKPSVIVMMTNLMEGTRVKVAKYWPDKGASIKYPSYGLVISMIHETFKTDYIIRKFKLRHGENTHKVLQYHFTKWPDHGVPEHPFGVTEMMREVCQQPRNAPFVVHCSAGIGRTGSVLLILHVLDQLKDMGSVYIKGALIDLRCGRPKLVDNVEQYRFAHRVLYEYLYGERTNFTVEQFIQVFPNLQTPQSPDNMSSLSRQFLRLRNLPKRLTYNRGRNREIIHLNRESSILPADANIVHLQRVQGEVNPAYINAITVCGLLKKDQYIVTEHPQQHTLDSVWQLVYERAIPVWVLLHTFPQNNHKYPKVIPEPGSTLEFHYMRVTVSASTDYVASSQEVFTEYVVDVSIIGKNLPARQCTVIQMKGWPHISLLPKSHVPLLVVLDRLENNFMSRNRFGPPPLISCTDGASGSGVAVTLHQMIARVIKYEEVDVYRAAVSATNDRPEFLSSVNQYKFLHSSINHFIQYRNSLLQAQPMHANNINNT